MIAFVYSVVALWLSLYGMQALLLTLLYHRHRSECSLPAAVSEVEWPRVAVQLPVFNERHVVERLIDAVTSLDYPRDLLEIQVLDDSTDDTAGLVDVRVAHYRAQGIDIQVLRRPEKEGFKAGALAWGTARTNADFVAVFDADFQPRLDFLRRTLPSMLAHPDVGMVQTRWSHLNEDYSLLTRVQSLALDAHFVVEQTARSRTGLLINFNGSGGVWRRACIESAGGWQSDTLTEDMDLSYRAQLAGWRCMYLPEVDSPAELPAQMEAFRRQQARWAQGSIQCLRKLLWPILCSRLSALQKVMALVHVSGYFSQPLLLVLLLLSLPLMWLPPATSGLPYLLTLAGLGPPLLFVVSQAALYRDWKRRLLFVPALLVTAVGLSCSTSRAVGVGLTRWGGVFRRTPKFQLEGRGGRWSDSSYRLRLDSAPVAELALMLYAVAGIAVACALGRYTFLPFLLLCASGFGLVAGSVLWQARPVAAAI